MAFNVSCCQNKCRPSLFTRCTYVYAFSWFASCPMHNSLINQFGCVRKLTALTACSTFNPSNRPINCRMHFYVEHNSLSIMNFVLLIESIRRQIISKEKIIVSDEMDSHMHLVHWQRASQSFFFGFSSLNRIQGSWEDVFEFCTMRKFVVAITWSTYSSHIVANATGVFISWAIRLNWTFTTSHFPHIEDRWPMLQSSSHDIAPNAIAEHISQSCASHAAPSGEFTMKYAVTLNTREFIVMRGAQYLKSIRTRCNRIKSENWTGFSLLRLSAIEIRANVSINSASNAEKYRHSDISHFILAPNF